MKNRLTYILTKNRYNSIVALVKVVACFFLLFSSFQSFANEDPVEDEIPVLVTVQGVGSAEIPAIIRNEVIYLSITDIFDYLKIKNVASAQLDSISGFFLNQQATYLIDKKHNRITYQEKVFSVSNGVLIKTENTLYLRSDYLGRIFGLECKFNFRSLSVILNSTTELPVVREMRQAEMRNNLSRLRGEEKADTNIARRYSLFHFGMADWSVISTQDIKGQNETRLNLGLGSVIAGGEVNAILNYSNNMPFTERQQYYQWHFVNNDQKGLRQVTAGKIIPQAISSIYSPVVGVQFTNTPTTYRRSFGTYNLSNYTEPGWTVELYVNNVLVNYVVADASGFYTFEVPLVYGNSVVKLRFYGLYGEERSTEQNINIPFNFLPEHQFEYTVTGGMVEDSLNSRFIRSSFNYGMGSRLTVGGGLEYLSSVVTGENMPYVNASLRVTSNLLIAGEYTYGVRSKAILSYRMPSNLQFELDYTRYKKGQKAINNTFLEERKAIISYPFRGNKLSAFSRLTAYQIVLPPSGVSNLKSSPSKYTNLEALFSGVVYGLNTNFTTYALFTHSAQPYVYSNLSLVFRLPLKTTFTPQVQYEYNQQRLIGVKGELGKYLSGSSFVNVFYENNFKSNFKSAGLSFRYDLSFAQMGFSARHTNRTSTLVQSASGSLMYDGKRYLQLNNRSSVGKGGITVVPYLDLNRNGKRDKNEPKAEGLKLQISGGLIRYTKADTTFHISGLEAYANYILRVQSTFENIAWQLNKRTLNITIDPNQFKLVEIPITVVNEVTGTVYLKDSSNQKGMGRITICFYHSDSTLAGKTLSEADGSFDFTALPPGSYTAGFDPTQLKKLGMYAVTAPIPFTLSAGKEGDVVDGLELILQPLATNIAADTELSAEANPGTP